MLSDQEPLPGLEDTQPGGLYPLEVAARRSLAALEAAGLLNASHALPMALVLSLAQAVAYSSATGKASAAALAAAQLREAFGLLPALEVSAAGGDEWDQLAADLRASAESERARAKGLQ